MTRGGQPIGLGIATLLWGAYLGVAQGRPQDVVTAKVSAVVPEPNSSAAAIELGSAVGDKAVNVAADTAAKNSEVM